MKFFFLCFQVLYFIYNGFALFLFLNTFRNCFFVCQSLIITDHKATRFICLTNKVKEGYVSFLPFSKEGKMFHNILTLRLIFNAYFWKWLLLRCGGSVIQLYFLRLCSLDLCILSISKDYILKFHFKYFFCSKFLEAFLVFSNFCLHFLSLQRLVCNLSCPNVFFLLFCWKL